MNDFLKLSLESKAYRWPSSRSIRRTVIFFLWSVRCQSQPRPMTATGMAGESQDSSCRVPKSAELFWMVRELWRSVRDGK